MLLLMSHALSNFVLIPKWGPWEVSSDDRATETWTSFARLKGGGVSNCSTRESGRSRLWLRRERKGRGDLQIEEADKLHAGAVEADLSGTRSCDSSGGRDTRQ